MYKVVAILLIFVFAINIDCEAQKRIMIYCTSEKFLIPIIEKSLTQIEEKNVPLFNEVANLNEILSNIASDKVLREAVLYLSAKSSVVSDSAKNLYESIASILTQFDYFLTININRIEASLEYQFYLYDSKSFAKLYTDSTFSLPTKKLSKPNYINSFLINIGESDYSAKIKLEIYKMFPSANSAPLAVISKEFERLKELYIGIGDSINLNSNYSTDNETFFKDLEFEWSQRPYAKNIKTPAIILEPLKTSCRIIGISEGFATISLKVFDGVSKSLEDTMRIYVYKRPVIIIPIKNEIYVSQGALFNANSTFYGSIPVVTSNYTNVDSNSVKIRLKVDYPDTLSLLYSHFMQRYASMTKENYSPPPPPPLDEYLKRPSGIVRFKEFEKMEEGFVINYFYQFQKFSEIYAITVTENKLTSKSHEVLIQNKILSPLSFFGATQIIEVLRVNKRLSDTIPKKVITQLSFGLQLRLYSSKSKYFSDFAFSVGRIFNNDFLIGSETFKYKPVTQQDLILGRMIRDPFRSAGVAISHQRWVAYQENNDKNRFRKNILIPSFFIEIPLVRKVPLLFSIFAGLGAIDLTSSNENTFSSGFAVNIRVKVLSE